MHGFIRYYRRRQHPLNILNKESFDISYLGSGKNENVIRSQQADSRGISAKIIGSMKSRDRILRGSRPRRLRGRARIAESQDPTKTLGIGIPICGSLCRNWYTPRSKSTTSCYLPHSFVRSLARVKPQVADNKLTQACGYPTCTCWCVCTPTSRKRAGLVPRI